MGMMDNLPRDDGKDFLPIALRGIEASRCEVSRQDKYPSAVATPPSQ